MLYRIRTNALVVDLDIFGPFLDDLLPLVQKSITLRKPIKICFATSICRKLYKITKFGVNPLPMVEKLIFLYSI